MLWMCYFRHFLCQFLSWCQNLHKLAMMTRAFNTEKPRLDIGFNITVVDFSLEICLKKDFFDFGRKFPLGEWLRLMIKLLTR